MAYKQAQEIVKLNQIIDKCAELHLNKQEKTLYSIILYDTNGK